MRYLQLAVAGLFLSTSCPTLLSAAPTRASASKPLCKKIRDAVGAGKTLEQITAEFDTDAATVMKCTQKKGKGKKGPRSPKKATQKSTQSTKSPSRAGTSSTEKAKSQAPAAGQPPVPRSGGRSAHQP
jgi:hypothetical protein